mmetsp:Transcript_21328/g.47167  ORF Transcript_21328/g.47167 Transcript_21328/m.47167 type:complete len:224 (+) Transcript_21328:309-980(+)
MAEVTVLLVEGSTLHLLLPSPLEVLLRRGPRVDLEGEGVGCLQLVIDPVQASPGARVADFAASRSEGAMAMVAVERLQDLHHLGLVALCQVLPIEGPGHVHALGAAVHREEGGGPVGHNELLEDTRLWLTEGLRAWVCIGERELGLFCWLPFLVPVPVEVHAAGIRPKAEIAAFHLSAGLRIAVDHDLEFAVAEHLPCALGQGSLSAECPEQVQTRLRRDELP